MIYNPLKDPLYLVVHKDKPSSPMANPFVVAGNSVFEDIELARDFVKELDGHLKPKIVRLEGIIAHVLRATITMARGNNGLPETEKTK